jgi:hypothetical protein
MVASKYSMLMRISTLPSAAKIMEDEMSNDRLLSEIERQKKYLSKLPDNFEFPLFNSQQALESQRRNGYRDTASAAREIIDNSLEAGATEIHVVFDRHKSTKGKDLVTSVAFIDNGSGMLPKMAQYALSLGGGTHFDDSNFIGKFGFGLPNASINQTRRVEVYTRTEKKESITMAVLDVTRVKMHGLQTVEEPVEAKLPKFVQQFLDRTGLKFDQGTIVVWVDPDRLTYRTAGSLKEHLVDDFGVTYRYLLNNIKLIVEGVEVDIVDPLFLDPNGRYYKPKAEGGADPQLDRTFPVIYFQDPDTSALHLKKAEDAKDIEKSEKDENVLAIGNIQIRIARLPLDFVAKKGEAVDSAARKRFEIRQSRRGMSFVRAGREIETVDAFPRSMRDRASGLGKWPLLQSFAYNWGVEVKFSPELDEVFGITNDKQRVRPIEDFWRLLCQEEVDRRLREENAWQGAQRDERKKAKAIVATSDSSTPAEQAAAAVDTVTGRRSRVPEHALPQAKAEFEAEAQRRVGKTAKSIEEARAAVENEAKRRRYKIDYFDDSNGPFYEPRWELGDQVVVRINRQHPFYETLYGELLRLPGGLRAKESVDVLLIALAKAELIIEDEIAKLWYLEQRRGVWSPFLSNALKVLVQTLQGLEEEEEESNVDEEAVA